MSEDPIGFGSGDTNKYRYVSNNSVDEVDPLGLAKICKRAINGMFVTGELLDILNLEIAHEQVVYEDSLGGTDGFFRDPNGNGTWGNENASSYTGPKTSCDEKKYDDSKMRKAVAKVKSFKRKYNQYGRNCQDIMDIIRQTYKQTN